MKKRVRKSANKKASNVSKHSTKLKKINSKLSRISSGITQFDKLIEGGFEKNSTNLVMGSPGSGKTIFSTSFIIEGLKNGENCLYISFEENKQTFFHNMKRFNWNLEEYEKKGKFTFLNYAPEKVKSMLEEGGGLIESIILKNKISRVVIDNMTSFTLLFEDELQKRETNLELLNLIKKWDCTSLITFEDSSENQKIYPALEFEADSVILLSFIKKLFSRERYVEVLKMRGTNHSNLTYKFSITKNGIIVNSNQKKRD